MAVPEIVRRYREVRYENWDRLLFSDSAPQVTIIVPAYNEEKCIVFTVNNLLHLTYRYKEIIIVNDGSKDNTLEVLKKTFHLFPVPPRIPPLLKTQRVRNYYRSQEYPNLVVVDKENGGKVDSNNAGVNVCTSAFFLIIDADTIVLDQTIQSLIRPFFMSKNMIATGGSIGIVNGCELRGNRIVKIHFPRQWITAIQVIEYLRAFFMGRQGWNRMGGCMLISGAFGLFDKKKVVEIGGYQREIGDDVDLVFRLHARMREKKEKYEIRMIPDLCAMTEAPFTWDALGNQRERWQRGLIATLWDNKKMMFNPRYGLNGMLCYPYFAIIEAISPIIESLGYVTVLFSFLFGYLNAYAALWFLLLALGFPMFLTLFVILLQYISFQWYFSFADTCKMVLCAVLEQLGYRQYLVFYRLLAFYKWMKGECSWKKIEREGFKDKKL